MGSARDGLGMAMGKTGQGLRTRRGSRTGVRGGLPPAALLLPVLLLPALPLAGCAHRDAIDAPVGWWHQLEGGAIAEQRPPPPGVNDPYPKVGTTPAHAPAIASLDLRHSVTTDLLRQRNLANRLDANDPIPVAVARPAKPAAAPAPAAPAAGGSSAMLDAAEAPVGTPPSGHAPPDPAPAGAPAGALAGKRVPTPPPDADAEPELALPAVVVQAPDASGAPVIMPAIPGAPPAAPRLPGLAVAASLPTIGLPASERLPAYAVAPAAGTPIDFVSGTDTMLGGQSGALHAIAARRGGGAIVVHGYGDAAAADPDTQSQALSVATLRARTVAEALQAEGVPAGSIRLRAEAFGRGASVRLVQ